MQKPNSPFQFSIYYRFAVLAFCFVGCGQTATREKSSATKQPAQTETTPVDLYESDLEPPDRSLAFDDYVVVGMPGYEQPWSSEDMENVVTLLLGIASKDPTQLPRKDSRKSGRMFARMTSEENLNQYQSNDLDIDEKFASLMSFSEATKQILKIYLIARTQNAVGPQEVIDAVAMQMRVTVPMMDIVEEHKKQLLKESDLSPIRIEALQGMKNGLAKLTEGSLAMLLEERMYPLEDRKRLAGCLKTTLPKIVLHLSEASRVRTVSTLRGMVGNPGCEDLKPEFEALTTAVETSLASKISD